MSKTKILKIGLLLFVVLGTTLSIQAQNHSLDTLKQVSGNKSSDLFVSKLNQRISNGSGGCPLNKRANFWYFGINAGIDFNSGSAVALTNGQLNTREGVATISDINGSLLFYTDGSTVWNKNHSVMATGLFGNASSTQSAVIIPNPGNASKYYIFTADYVSGTNGYCYSEVDMTLNSGLGGVLSATKNTLLFSNQSEKITATKHANGKDIWLVLHESNNSNFRTHLVSASGIAPAIVSTAGSATTSSAVGSNSIGYMKFSRDGSMLIDVYNGLNYSSEIFNFNTSTGVITGPTTTLSPLSACYGAEFSNSGQYVYIAELQRSSTIAPGYNNRGAISQYNLKAGNNAAINASRTQLVQSSTIGYGALQMAPDGKIYAGKENGYNVGVNYLGVINNPDNAAATTNYQDNGFYLSGRQTMLGLPNFISFDYLPIFNISGKQNVCVGEEETYTIITSQSFDVDDEVKNINGASLDVIAGTVTDSISTFTFQFETAGQTMIKVQSHSTSSSCPLYVSDSLLINIFNGITVDLGKDSTFCYTPLSYTLDAGSSYSSYLWNNGSTNETYTVYKAGKYWVTVKDANGCAGSDTVNLNIQPLLKPLHDTVICQHTTVVLNPGSFTHYLWQDYSTNPTYTATAPGNYSLKATDANGCNVYDTIAITLISPFDIVIPDVTKCNNASVVLDPGAGFTSYKWQDGSTSETYTVKNSGLYSVIVTHYCESAQDTVEVSNYPATVIHLSHLDSSYCISHEDILLSASPTGGIFSGSGVDQYYLHINDLHTGLNGILYSYTDGHGCITKATSTFLVNDDCFFIPNLITINNDNLNDYFHVIGIGTGYTLEVYNRWNDLVYKKENYDNSYDGKGQNDGVYFYHLYNSEMNKSYKGWVQLIR